MSNQSRSRATPTERHRPPPPSEGSFRLDGWEVEPRALALRRTLADRTEERRVEPRVMALLVCLAEHAGRPVTREELLERVWSDVVVGDDAIHSAVSKLRRALANGSDGATVETVPKVGYRLAAPVEWIEGSAGSGEEADDAPPRYERRRHLLVRGGLAFLVVVMGLSGYYYQSPRPGTETPVASGPGAPQLLPVTSWEGLEVEPAFAPGETEDRVAFASRGPGEGSEGGSWDLWVQVLGAGDPFRLTDHPGDEHHPAWSPDARHVAFVRHHEGVCSVHRVPALGGREIRLAGCRDAQNLTWTPDGGALLWTDRPGPDAPFRVAELTLDGGALRELTRPAPGSVGDLGPVVSPDGATLAFLRSPVLGVQDIYLLPYPVPAGSPDSSGGEPRRLTHDALKIHGADWTPDGRHLVFSSNRAGLFSLWRVAVGPGEGSEATEPVWLGVSGGDLDDPSVGGGGRRVAYEQWTDDTNLYRVALDPESGAEPERVLGSTRWDWGPDVAPGTEGERIAFVSDRSGTAELWLAESPPRGAAGGMRERRLTSFGGPYVGSPRFAPDGRSIAFDARPGGNADVWIQTSDGGEPRRLTDHPAQDEAPTWSRDGRWVYFASDRSGAWQVWRVAASAGDGAEPSRVTREGGYRAQESADGRWLYLSRRHEAGIWRLPLSDVDSAGAEPELVVSDLVPLDRAHWRVTDNGLFYLRRPRHDRPVLTRFDPESGTAVEIAELGAIPYNSGLALSADGRWALFTRKDRWESDVMVVEGVLGGSPERASGSARAARP